MGPKWRCCRGTMCGPTGLSATIGFSGFGVLFLSLLAVLISRGYPYVGEWYQVKSEDGGPAKPFEEQQAAVVSALWNAVFLYLIVGGLAGLGLCFHTA